MMQRFDTEDGPEYGPGAVCFYRPEQLRTISEWNGVADREEATALLHAIKMQRAGASTTTDVNQLMPVELNWLDIPSSPAPVVPVLNSRGI